ncbi:MAG: hypothetical protein ACRDQX_13035 [Pseudonocardiaceae bacterium]
MTDNVLATPDQPAERAGTESGHPTWCSPDYCYVTDDGVRVHEQAPVVWEDEAAEVRFDSRLFDPADDPDVYVELFLQSVRVPPSGFYGAFPLHTARRLRDELTAHLDSAELS